MMNKFHKTTYARGANFNAISSSHGRRNPNQIQQTEWPSKKNEAPLERKIEIESSLLLNQKNYNQSNNFVENTRKITNKSQIKLYETTSGFNNIRQRPQSKQQPRSKGVTQIKLKTQALLPQRPQTSKGVRHFRGKVQEEKDQQTYENFQQFPIQVKITDKKSRNARGSYSRKGGQANQSNIVAFDTSIDPQFLSLFAN